MLRLRLRLREMKTYVMIKFLLFSISQIFKFVHIFYNPVGNIIKHKVNIPVKVFKIYFTT